MPNPNPNLNPGNNQQPYNPDPYNTGVNNNFTKTYSNKNQNIPYPNDFYNNQPPLYTNNIANPNQKKRNLNPNKKKDVKKMALIAVIAIAVLSLISVIFAIFIYPSLNQNNLQKARIYNNVAAKIIAPNTLPQGTPGDWEVEIENLEPVALSNIKLELKFDPGFQFIQAYNPSPDDARGRVYSLPRLDPAGGRTTTSRVRFQGSLNANVDIETEMGATLSYVPELGNGQFGELTSIELAVVRTKVVSPQVKISLEPARNTVENGSQTEFRVVVENISDQEIRNLRLRMIYPRNNDSFTYLSSEYVRTTSAAPVTQPDDGDDTWFITRLPSRAKQTLKVVGTVFGSNNSRLTFGSELSIQSQGGNYQPIWTGYRDITIMAQPILVQTSIKGKQADSLIEAGETLQIEVKYQNQSNTTVQNAEIIAFLSDPANMLDLSTLNFSGGERGDLSGSELVWRSPRVPNLASILPNQSGSFVYTVKVKDNFIDNRLNQQQYTVTPGVRAKARTISEVASTGPSYKARGRFIFDAPRIEMVGTNPKTNRDIYRVVWKLSNSQNEIQEAEVRAILPIVGAWDENSIKPVSAKSSISHNETTGEIIWRVGRIESYTGRVRTPIEISFDLQVDKNEQELLRNLRATGVDVFTGEKFQDNKGNIRR